MNAIPFSSVKITSGFWKTKQDLVRDTTVHAVYDRFKETHRFEALKCQWKPGDPDMPHIFWDSDVAKWIEGVGYLLNYQRDDTWKHWWTKPWTTLSAIVTKTVTLIAISW